MLLQIQVSAAIVRGHHPGEAAQRRCLSTARRAVPVCGPCRIAACGRPPGGDQPTGLWQSRVGWVSRGDPGGHVPDASRFLERFRRDILPSARTRAEHAVWW